MRRWARRATVAGVLVLAGCGGTRTVTRTVTVPQKAVNGHICSPADEAMQCVLPPPPASLHVPVPGSGRVLPGVDFAWGAPSAAQMRANHRVFGASYLSFDPSKGWEQRPGLVGEYHRAGIATVAVWETSANRAAQGCAAGRADALEARLQAARIGNTDRPIDFAIDFDATGAQIDAYFRCGHQVLGARENAYGGYAPLAYLCAHGLVGRTSWQTYAWSGGRWLPASCAPLEQWLNGSAVDYDRAIAPDYGQWPGPRITPQPTPGQLRLRRLRRLRSLRAHVALRRELHGDLERHHCRRGQHVTPRVPIAVRRKVHDELCPRWKAAGDRAIATITRNRRELGLR